MSKHIIPIDLIENSNDKTLQYHFCDYIEDVSSSQPIVADLTIKSLGEFIQVSGNVTGILKLDCDVCLSEFDYKLDFPIDEIFAKYALSQDYAQETEIKDGQFITDLNGAQEIDIYDLLYQSVILNLPNKKVCGINCNGKEFLKEDDLTDPRMEIFKNIKIQGE